MVVVSPILRGVFTPIFTTHFPIYCLTIFRADTLAIGAFIAIVETEDVRWIERRRNTALGCVAGALVLFGLCSMFASFRTGANSVLFNSVGYSLSVILFGSILVYTLGLRQGVFHSILTARPVRYLRLISYTFYLYHVAALLKVEQHVHSTILAAALALAVTIAIAMISWHFLESPILKMRETRGMLKPLPTKA